MKKRLYRSRNRMIAGVCAGVAEYLDIDPTVVRLLWFVTVIFAFTGVLLYLVAWIIVPEDTFNL